LESTLIWVRKRLASPDARDAAYQAMVMLLDKNGFFAGLPVDSSGVLVVSAPFCQEFSEAPLLLPFLSERVEGTATGIAVHGSDVNHQPYWWGSWEEWTRHTLGSRGVSLQLRKQDLEREQPQRAGLIIACHPEVTNGGPWLAILANVLKSRTPGARCAFTNFYRAEAEATARICRAEGASCQILENPFYAGRNPTEVGTCHRFAVIVDP
ncbi:unnamed protein product, partial [Polarella glacialis]